MFIKRILLVITFVIMTFFGFRTDTSLHYNNYNFTEQTPGLTLTPHSMAYTETFPSPDENTTERLNIDFTISPEYPEPNRFGLILQIYDKKTDSEISVGQWDKSLVILNNDDYSNSRRLPKIYSPLEGDSDDFSVSIQSGTDGTKVVINDLPAGYNSELHLRLPTSGEGTHLIVGNGIRGRTPWSGRISSLTIYSPDTDITLLSYTFDDEQSTLIQNHSGNDYPLILPLKVRSLKKTVLQFPDRTALRRSSMKTDLFFNFFGFIPLGFLLVVNLPERKRKMSSSTVAILFCFFFSLTIELTQIGLPARDSSFLDLILNTIGGVFGVLAARVKVK